MTNYTQTPQAAFLVVMDETIGAQITATPQAALLTVTEADSVPKTSQAAFLYVYGEGARENTTLRAWSFILDGHSFYVLHLGMLGTLVYDTTTAQWSEFGTSGFETWNAEQGVMWQDMIVAGDNFSPVLWRVDPRVQLDDDFRPITHRATALVPARGRDTATVGMLSINASAGYPVDNAATLTLRFSDDDGVTFTDMQPITLEDGNYNQNLAFGSLGSFGQPGRVFEIEDVGGFVRLSDADLVIVGGRNARKEG